MSKEEFELKQATIDAIPDNEVKYPGIPVDTALQESEDLFVWCQTDKALLVKSGLDWNLVKDLPARTGACRYVQSQWQKEYQNLEDAQTEWKEKSKAAYLLRDELVHDFYHAFYRFSDLYASVQKIAEGSSHADMIQDLSDLSALGKENTEPLTAININLNQLDLAAKTSEKMAVLLSKSNGERMENNQVRLMRDKAYMHMKEAMDEIRHCGLYVFWKDEQRRKGYISRYNKLRKQAKPKSGQNPEETK